jgi:hypothetical protein
MTYIRVSESLQHRRESGREKVRAEGHCRMCLRSSAELSDLWERPDAVRIMTRHHLVPQHFINPEWKRFRDCNANIVPLCRGCHDLVEMRGDNGRLHRRLLRRVLTQEEIVFILQVRGRKWLEKRYPLPGPVELERVAVSDPPSRHPARVLTVLHA